MCHLVGGWRQDAEEEGVNDVKGARVVPDPMGEVFILVVSAGLADGILAINGHGVEYQTP